LKSETEEEQGQCQINLDIRLHGLIEKHSRLPRRILIYPRLVNQNIIIFTNFACKLLCELCIQIKYSSSNLGQSLSDKQLIIFFHYL